MGLIETFSTFFYMIDRNIETTAFTSNQAAAFNMGSYSPTGDWFLILYHFGVYITALLLFSYQVEMAVTDLWNYDSSEEQTQKYRYWTPKSLLDPIQISDLTAYTRDIHPEDIAILADVKIA